jgi:hypothetical protein
MTATPQPRSRLDELGDALHAAATADLARRERARRRHTLVGALAAAAIVLPGAAVATNALITDDQVANSIPSGTWALIGTEPHCTTIRANVEFDCVLETTPKQGDIPAGAWKNTVEPTVDDTKHVNGGCRALNAEGTHWRCYIGQEAVRQQIIGPDFLGGPAPTPGRG